SPLIIALDKGHYSIFKALLESGKFDHDATDAGGRSALGYAVRRRNYEAVRLLIESGVDAGRQEAAGITPLNMAVAQGDEDIVRVLL
ncbi:ankyrin, partial [Aspergillus steynii IBT 23096]